MRKKILLSVILFIINILTNFIYSQYFVDWALTYGGGGWDEATCLVQSPSGDIYIGGSMRIISETAWILKIDSKGKKKWGKTFSSAFTTKIRDMAMTPDSHLIITGYTVEKDSVSKKLWLMKVDTLGKIVWEKKMGDDFYAEGYCIINTKDKGFALAGYKTSSITFSEDWWVLKLDANGNTIWEKQFGGSKEDVAKSVVEMDDESIIATGFSGSAGGGFRSITAVKINKDGTEDWYKVYRINDWDEATSITKTYDNNIVIGGFTKYKAIKDYDAVVIKINASGDTLWQRIFSRDIISEKSTIGDYQKKSSRKEDYVHWDEACKVLECYDQGIIMGGFSKVDEKMRSNFMIVKYDELGNLIFYDFFDKASLDIAANMIETIDNSLILVGTTHTVGSAWDYAILKYNSIEKSYIKIKTPKDSITATISDTLKIEFCIKTLRPLFNYQILINGIGVDYITTFPAIIETDDEEECSYNLTYKLPLLYGINEIEVKVIDQKGYMFSDFRTIYYYPNPTKTW